MSKEFVTWDEIERLVMEALLPQLDGPYDAILGITRGGMVPACLVSERLDIRHVLTAAVKFYTDVEETLPEPIFLQFPGDTLIAGKRVLIVDDVWDTGHTAYTVRERVRRAGGKPTVAVIHYKPLRSEYPDDQPDYFAQETDAWIVYPWDPDKERLLGAEA
ncbi:MAG: hypothetical protein KDD73_06460 [Anaerolineales bacterium]|nr:hypothetical protein [Anaerolineales bacterium]